MTELVLVRKGRPTSVQDAQGVVTFISTHDTYFLTTQAAYKRELVRLHPDKYRPTRGGYHGVRFIECMTAYCRWMGKEIQWYKNFGLVPPSRKL